MKFIKLLLLLLCCLFTLYSCTSDSGDLPLPSQDTLLNDTSLINLNYNDDIKPILVNYCYGTGTQRCHVTNSNQGSNGDYTSYAGIKAKVDNGSLQVRALSPQPDMPPAFSMGPRPLAPHDLNKMKSWVNQGAPEN